LAALAVAVGVENERGPALRLGLVAGFLEHACVDPAGGAALRTARTGPQRVVLVEAELHVVGREAGRDRPELELLRVVHGDLAARLLDREHLGGGMVGALLAEIRVGRRPAAGREPDPALVVVVEAVRRGLRIPDRVAAEIGRRRKLRTLARGLGI